MAGPGGPAWAGSSRSRLRGRRPRNTQKLRYVPRPGTRYCAPVSVVRRPPARAVVLYRTAVAAAIAALLLIVPPPAVDTSWLTDVAVLAAVSLAADATRSRKPGWLG